MILKNLNIYTEDGLIEKGFIELENKKIKNYGLRSEQGIDLNGYIAVPGFIDQHFHGVNGLDLMSCDKEGLSKISKKILEYGVTSYLPTTLTEDLDIVKDVLKRVSDYKKENNQLIESEIIGIHLEGPFLNNEFCGAQDEKFIIDPSIDTFDELQESAQKEIKMVTYALEKGDKNFTKYLASNNVVPSVGHSAATFKEVEEAVNDGLKSITHFHNASSKYHHRNPGVVNAGLYFDELNVELIADGNHVDKDVLKMVKKIKGSSKINLVTDSSSATGLPDGTYKLGHQKIIKKGESVTLENGVLAGSALKMSDAFKNMKEYTSSSVYELIEMISTNPAKLIGIEDRKGSIKIGKDADIVVLDKDFNVFMTIIRGEVGYKRGA